MKPFSFFLLVFVFGCSSDLEINQNHPVMPVIYAIINPYDSVHYVSVQKTFTINTKGDWSNLNADSLQFQDVEVFLLGKKGDSIKWAQQFSKTSSYKDTGLFPSGNYQVFKLHHSLPIVLSNPNQWDYGLPDIDSLILEVRIHELELVTRAAAKVLLPVKIINYKSRNVMYVYGSHPSVFALPSTGESSAKNIQLIISRLIFEYITKNIIKIPLPIRKFRGWQTPDGTIMLILSPREDCLIG
jgi:hypothetical protein